MKHLLSCLGSYKKEAILAPLFKLLEASMELTVPLIVELIINRGIAEGDRRFIVWMCLVLVAFAALGLAFALTAQYFAARAAVGVSAKLRRALFRKLQTLSYSQIDGLGTARMTTLMTSDVNQVQTGVNMALRLFLRSPFIVFGAMILAFVKDAHVAVVFAAVIPLLAAVVYTVMGICIPLYQRVQNRLDGVYLSARENLAGVRVIRAFSLEEKEEELFKERTDGLKRAQKRAGAVAALTGPLTYVLVNLALIALLYLGGLRVESGALTQGGVVALYSYLAQILVELIKLANLIVTVTKAVSCQKRIGKVLDMEGEKSVLSDDLLRKGTAHISFEEVGFSYGGEGANALGGITFSVQRGQTVGILGGTGSGKSTLVNLIPRFYEATEGTVRVDGLRVDAIPAEELRARIAVVPQHTDLFRGSIRSNLLWGRADATDEDLLRAVRLAQAEDVVAAKGGLLGEISQDGKNLSGGQRQRLAIARALVKDPEILILDDSFSALDYATERDLRAALSELPCTVFVVSQRASAVRHADLILVLDEGRLAGIGTHESLMDSSDVYREICASQEGGQP